MKKFSFVLVGMAGTGKSTFTSCLKEWLENDSMFFEEDKKNRVSLINLDPATIHENLVYDIDIRNTFNLEETMNKFKLGPNGAITTSLNLFMIQSEFNNKNISIFDTPGQIEAFVWSNGGKVLIEKLKGSTDQKNSKKEEVNKEKETQIINSNQNNNIFILFLCDSNECKNPSVFICSMMYALLIKERFSVPLILIFNKIDISPIPVDYFDLDNLILELNKNESMNNSLIQSMALHFIEYYEKLEYVGISAKKGIGKEDFMDKIKKMLKQ